MFFNFRLTKKCAATTLGESYVKRESNVKWGSNVRGRQRQDDSGRLIFVPGLLSIWNKCRMNEYAGKNILIKI